MKSFNEHLEAKLASLRRQHTHIAAQIAALETYRNTAKGSPKPLSKPPQTQRQKTPSKSKPKPTNALKT